MKTALERVVPPVFEVEIRGVKYGLQRLTLKGIFRLGAMISKLSTIIDFGEIIAVIDNKELSKEEKEQKVGEFTAKLIAVLPLCETDIFGFIQAMLVDSAGKHPSLEDVAEMTSDDVIAFLRCFAETEDLLGVLTRFFGVATEVLVPPKTAG